MKKLLFAALAVLALLNACRKDADQNNVNPGSGKSTTPYGLGEILDKQAYAQLANINFQEVNQRLSKLGYRKVNVEATLPSAVVVSHPNVGNQGATGTCVSWSVGYCAAGVLNLEYPVSGLSNNRSPWFIYRTDHAISGSCSDDDGMNTYNGLKLLRDSGVCHYDLLKDMGSPCTRLSADIRKDAKKNANVQISKLSSLDDIRQALAGKFPVVLRLDVYQEFYDAFNNKKVYSGTGQGTYQGGHAMCAIGYDDAKKAVLVQNSWGTSGGDSNYPGCIWMSYDLFTKSNKLNLQYYAVTR